MGNQEVVINRIIEVSEGKIYMNLQENEIIEKMKYQYFFGVIEYSIPADDVPSDDRIMIHYYFSFDEYQDEIHFLESKLYQAMKVVNRFEFKAVSFYSGSKKPIGYQVDASSILQ